MGRVLLIVTASLCVTDAKHLAYISNIYLYNKNCKFNTENSFRTPALQTFLKHVFSVKNKQKKLIQNFHKSEKKFFFFLCLDLKCSLLHFLTLENEIVHNF